MSQAYARVSDTCDREHLRGVEFKVGTPYLRKRPLDSSVELVVGLWRLDSHHQLKIEDFSYFRGEFNFDNDQAYSAGAFIWYLKQNGAKVDFCVHPDGAVDLIVERVEDSETRHKLTANISSSYPVPAFIGSCVEIQRVELVRPLGSQEDKLALMVSIDGASIEYPMDPKHLEQWAGSMAFEANQAMEKKMLKRHLLMVGQPYSANCVGTRVVVRVGSKKSGEVFGEKEADHE